MPRSAHLSLLLSCCLCLLLAGPADARRAVVKTTDGRTLEGELLSQNEGQVVLEISGIRTTLDRADIESVEIKQSIEAEYRQRRAELEDNDLEGRRKLANFLFEHGEYELAAKELADLRERFPDDERVELLNRVVQERLKLMREQQNREEGEGGQQAERRPREDDHGRTTEVLDQRLTQEQINLIRVYEVDLDEEPPVRIGQETISKLFERYSDNRRVPKTREGREAFRRLPGHRQLELFFDLTARNLYREVRVLQDAPAMRQFRSRIHNSYVLNYCGTRDCHGGQAVGGLYLFRVRPNSDRTVYSNFYILNEYENAQGDMINRNNPGDSLLLQYGLPRNLAGQPHPDVDGWRPMFPQQQNRRFQRYADVLEAFYTPRPNYRINYQAPGAAEEQSATQEGGAQAEASPSDQGSQ